MLFFVSLLNCSNLDFCLPWFHLLTQYSGELYSKNQNKRTIAINNAINLKDAMIKRFTLKSKNHYPTFFDLFYNSNHKIKDLKGIVLSIGRLVLRRFNQPEPKINHMVFMLDLIDAFDIWDGWEFGAEVNFRLSKLLDEGRKDFVPQKIDIRKSHCCCIF